MKNKTQLLHCVIDDKFIDKMIVLFESLEDIDNHYVLFYKNQTPPKPIYVKDTRVKLEKIASFNNYIETNGVRIVVLHSLYSLPFDLISKIQSKIIVVWFSWGFDIYSRLQLIRLNNRYLPITNYYLLTKKVEHKPNKLQIILAVLKSKVKLLRRVFLNPLIFRALESKRNARMAIARINYYSGVYSLEYDKLSSSLSCFNAYQIEFNYPTNEFNNVEIETEIKEERNDILIGQAAFPQLNHLDVFVKLKNILMYEDRKIIVPLSYGSDNLNYKETVINTGFSLFSKNFMPITKYLTLDDYNKQFENCGYAVFAVEQQSAVGNILFCFWSGMKVFLSVESMNYSHFKNLGMVVFSIERDFDIFNLTTTLNKFEIMRNRQIVSENYSFDAIFNKTKASFEKILDCHIV